MASPGRVRVHLVLDAHVNVLIDKISQAERRARSAVVEIAILEYAKKIGLDSHKQSGTKSSRSDT
jgi:hypothetical protein